MSDSIHIQESVRQEKTISVGAITFAINVTHDGDKTIK